MWQKILPIKNSVNYDFGNFTIGECNNYAYSWVENWPNWQENRFITFIGEKGAGKTHLMHLLQKKSQGVWLDHSHFSKFPSEFVKKHTLYLLDNGEYLNNDRWLFNLYNTILEANAFLVISMNIFPNEWHFTLNDWESRLKSFIIISMSLPNDEILAKILYKQFQDLGLIVDKSVINYLLCRTERSFTEVRRLANTLHHIATSTHKRLTVPLIKKYTALPSFEQKIDSES